MVKSLVREGLSSILWNPLAKKVVGNIDTPVYDFSLYTTFGLLKEAKLGDWPFECSLFRLNFDSTNEAVISWECLHDPAKIPSATGANCPQPLIPRLQFGHHFEIWFSTSSSLRFQSR